MSPLLIKSGVSAYCDRNQFDECTMMKKKAVLQTFGLSLAFAAMPSIAGKWGDYVTVHEAEGVIVTYHTRATAQGWFVEWKGKNGGAAWVEPVLNHRVYVCSTGVRDERGPGTLGPLPAGDERKGGVRDTKVCHGGEIKAVDAQVELRPVSDAVRRMWE